MTVATIFIVVAVLALSSLLWLASYHRTILNASGHSTAGVRFVDIEAFRNLVDPEEEEYLRCHLPGRDFRSIHRRDAGRRSNTFFASLTIPGF